MKITFHSQTPPVGLQSLPGKSLCHYMIYHQHKCGILTIILSQVQQEKCLYLFFISYFTIPRLNLVKLRFFKITKFNIFFQWSTFIMVNFVMKLPLQCRFLLKTPLKMPKTQLLEKIKISFICQIWSLFGSNVTKNGILYCILVSYSLYMWF